MYCTMPTNHLYNETTFGLVGLILDVALAAFDCCVFISHVAQSTLEYREKCLGAINTSNNTIEHLYESILCCTIDT